MPALPGNARVYHGGGVGRGGFPSGGGGGGIDTIRLVASEKEWHQGNTSPAIANLHTTPADSAYGLKTYDFNKTNRAFATIGLVHKDWDWILSGATGINMFHHFYHEAAVAAPNNIARFVTSIYIVRNGESLSFASMAGSYTFDVDCSGTAYNLITASFSNVVVNNPSGAVTQVEPIFHWRLRRLDTVDGDTYANVVRFLGGVIEYPISP